MKHLVEKHIWKILFVLLLVISSLLFRNWKLKEQVYTLLEEKKEYPLKESKAFIVERISQQMEEIAGQQREISDEQRKEAVLQMSIAEKMRVRAEEEGNRARQEQQKAQQYSLYLEDARNMAESEKSKAVFQRLLAEEARGKADTLSIKSLARSLASNALIQYQLHNYELSSLLAYGAWKLMKEYKGNVFYPIIYNALSANSESSLSKKIHKGGIVRILPCTGIDKGYISVSKYGEISHWYKKDNLLEKEELYSNSTYSFRDAYMDSLGFIYALDFNGTLLVLAKDKSVNKYPLPEDRGWKRVCPLDKNTLLLASTHNLYVFDKNKGLSKTVKISQEISCLGEQNGQWLVFGKEGGCWRIHPDGNLSVYDTDVTETITAYAWSEATKQSAVGTINGNIYLLSEAGKVDERLEGHRSQITQLDFGIDNLYSSSYDCHLNVWNLLNKQKEPLSLLETSSWIYCFRLSKNKSIWIGDESGSIYRILISPDDMAALIKQNIKRDFTDKEWMYYFGNDLSGLRNKILGKE